MRNSHMHICHVSMLNPARHSRIFYKMALAQVRAGYRVSIIAQDAATAPYMSDGVEIVPIGTFGRLHWRRFSSVRLIARLARALRADFYQVHTVELLPMARKLKAEIPGARVFFDMHEDYVANIRHADYYSRWLRGWLAARVQTELDAFPSWGDGLLLAEACFEGLVPMPKGAEAVVGNKFQAPFAVQAPRQELFGGLPYILFTGTIAENWGVFKAIELWRLLNQRTKVGLVIAGHGQHRDVIQRIHEMVEATELQGRIHLAGGESYLPYEEIVGFIQNCTLGVALYALKANILDRIPTKFYEYMAYNKPLVFTENPTWARLNSSGRFGVAISWPPAPSLISELVDLIDNRNLLAAKFPQLPESAWGWDSESSKMLALYDQFSAKG